MKLKKSRLSLQKLVLQSSLSNSFSLDKKSSREIERTIILFFEKSKELFKELFFIFMKFSIIFINIIYISLV